MEVPKTFAGSCFAHGYTGYKDSAHDFNFAIDLSQVHSSILATVAM